MMVSIVMVALAVKIAGYLGTPAMILFVTWSWSWSWSWSLRGRANILSFRLRLCRCLWFGFTRRLRTLHRLW